MGASKIFKLLVNKESDESGRRGVSIGIDLKISGIDADIPISPPCYSKEEFAGELQKIHNNLDEILSDAENSLGIIGTEANLNITPNMTSSDIWGVIEVL